MRVIHIALVAVALAWPVASTADESVLDFMGRYELALDRGDTGLLAEVYEEWTAEKARMLGNYFEATVAEFNVEFSDVSVERVEPDVARVRFHRHDRFTDRESGQRVRKQIWLEKVLRRTSGRWKVAPAH